MLNFCVHFTTIKRVGLEGKITCGWQLESSVKVETTQEVAGSSEEVNSGRGGPQACSSQVQDLLQNEGAVLAWRWHWQARMAPTQPVCPDVLEI